MQNHREHDQQQKSLPDFRFKQFSIWHDKCAMKVNTDGILLGAWSQINSRSKLIDIGTGTGLIALMLAQRSHTFEHDIGIVAVEIDKHAAMQARSNFACSGWQGRMQVLHQDILSFANSAQEQQQYSTLVSNPPYFSDSLKGRSLARNIARHNSSLPFDDLLKSAKLLSTRDGVLNLILPNAEAEDLLSKSELFSWYLSRRTDVIAVEGKLPSRMLMSLTRTAQKCDVDRLTIRDKSHNYTEQYQQLCKDFYLKF